MLTSDNLHKENKIFFYGKASLKDNTEERFRYFLYHANADIHGRDYWRNYLNA